MATVTDTATQTIRDFAEPARTAVHEHVRDLRRAALAGRHAAEECAAEARVQVRRYPFIALGIAVGLGTIIGVIAGFAAGDQFARRRSG
jgi:ElaB/YqjD/DUF883 family membrane-anchored ribosome-binding protein